MWREIPGPLTAAAFSVDGRFAAVANEATVTVYDLENWALVGSVSVGGAVEQLVFTPGGELIAAAGTFFTAWDAATLSYRWAHDGGRSQPRIAASPDGQFLAGRR